MKFKVFIVSILFVCSMLPGFSFAQNKVVVIPLWEDCTLDPEMVEAMCLGYGVLGKNPPATINCPSKIVFVSSIYYNGNLGGVMGADATCQALADASDLTSRRTFKAWISDDTSSPAADFVQSNSGYVLANGLAVALGWNDLTDGVLERPINVDEKGNTVTGHPTYGLTAWTGTKEDGTLFDSSQDCNQWTSSSASGHIGLPDRSDYGWTNWSGYYACSRLQRLYCFEQ